MSTSRSRARPGAAAGSSAAAGRLTKARKCSKRVFVRAKGTATWTLRVKRKLPRGRYAIVVRATDRAGNRQAKLATRTLRVR